jgi:hypothetical protein
MESKSGTYSAATYSTQRWHQNRFQWQSGQLVKVWTFDSDWVAPGSQNDFWEPVYHAVLANGFVYDPGAGGTIFKLDRATRRGGRPHQSLRRGGRQHVHRLSALHRRSG